MTLMEDKTICKGLDVLKVILAILITVLHLGPTASFFSKEARFILRSGITTIGVPGFFFLTGYLYKRGGKNLSDWSVAKRHIKRMLVLYCTWTGMYMPLIINNFMVDSKYEGYSILFKLAIFARRFILIGSWTPLWFFLGGVYGTAYIFLCGKLRFSEKKIIIIFGILTFIVASLNDCYTPIGKMFFGSFHAFDTIYHVIGWKEAVGGAFYMTIGSWSATHKMKVINTDFRRVLSIVACMFALMIEVLFWRELGAVNFGKMFTIVPIVIILVDFFAGKEFPKITEKKSKDLRRFSILIYGFHGISSFYLNESWISNSLFRYVVNMAVVWFASVCIMKFSQKKRGEFLRVLY